MKRLFYKYVLSYLSVILFCSTGYADNHLQQSALSIEDIKIQTNQTEELRQRASQWSLQPEEWRRYQELMSGQLGIYSPGLDPLTALGISARNDEERRRYAELQVIAEMQRVEHELAYQRAYDEAFERLYPTLLRVVFEPEPIFSSLELENNGRLTVFVQDNCTKCDAEVKQLQQSGKSFDIYVVNSNNDDSLIRTWAAKVGIDPKKVREREITLNHDAGLWKKLGIGSKLPAIAKKESGKWQRQ